MSRSKKISLTKEVRMNAYSAANYLNLDVEKALHIQLPFDVYLQDPLVAEKDPKAGFDENFYVSWEPGISDGPTSARFAIVDYNGDTDMLLPKAKWNEKEGQFYDINKKVLDKSNLNNLQFHQVNVWAILQRALAFFENGFGLGRPIPFGFEGNRLIVVPHAGYGQNAFYDRSSKSLQFYYFDNDNDDRIYTCLSADIINHEFGHAVLDGIRPYFINSFLVETGAFHEYIGDITAILILLRNNQFRKRLADKTDGDFDKEKILSSLAEQFGDSVIEKPYLRTARNSLKMNQQKVKESQSPHFISQVMTGAMFDILKGFANSYVKRAQASSGDTAKDVANRAFYWAIQRMQSVAVQPLDLLPPIDVTFKDYAKAVLKSFILADPKDPNNYYDMMIDAFYDRQILSKGEAKELKEINHIYEELNPQVYHSIDSISRSKTAAYKFLNDNRPQLMIPANQDIIVADLYDANKFIRRGIRMPRQIILQYLWREDVVLRGPQFGEYNGKVTTMLCGGTLVFNEKGTLLSWMRKPGTDLKVGSVNKPNRRKEIEAGKKRKEEFLETLAQRIQSGQVGALIGSTKGFLGTRIPNVLVKEENNLLSFELTPHFNLKHEEQLNTNKKWEISS
ncbi:Serine protease [Tenacibaculum sp. 190130A14a]|uniref:Serine protease n=1 Tax=Tenacibaculum polynesiense TaxID=3137857 RepID=A0ABM9PBX6_9FLAO